MQTGKKKTLIFTVSNDLQSDQRMQRICSALANDYQVVLIGRLLKTSKTIKLPFKTYRLKCFFNKGKLFYLELQIRLIFKLLFTRADAICAVDTDTLLAVFLSCKIKRVFFGLDAHELFTEVPELHGRPISRAIWAFVERLCIPKTDFRYTVCTSVANELESRYGLPFKVIRNLPIKWVSEDSCNKRYSKVIWYQGVLNQGRGLEQMIEAMALLDGWILQMAGRGEIEQELKLLANKKGISDRVEFLGHLDRTQMHNRASMAFLGINLLDGSSLNYYYSLANKFFDYVQAGLPQLCMHFPEYEAHMHSFKVGVLIRKIDPEGIAKAIIELYSNPDKYALLKEEIALAADEWIWEKEQVKLLKLYQNLNWS